MKKLLMSFLIVSNCYAQTFWSSDFPDHVNKFIYQKTHFHCAYSDYIDGIIAEEVFDSSQSKNYIASFSVFGEPENGYIAVDETHDGELSLSEIVCPKL